MGKESVFLNWKYVFLEMNVDLRLSLVKAKVSKLSEIVKPRRQALVPRQRQKHKPECLPCGGGGSSLSTMGQALPSHLTAIIPHLSDIVHDPPLACVHGYHPQKGPFKRFLYPRPLLRYLPYLRLDHGGLWSSNLARCEAEGLLELSHGCSIIFSLKGSFSN